MPDMLVKLYELPALEPAIEAQRAMGIEVRRAIAPERAAAVGWVRDQFGEAWASECEVTFARQPTSCFLAQERERLLGFACYDATARGVFGPTGVVEEARRRGVGAALLLLALHAMRAEGYAYAVIGGVGPADFYAKLVGAVEIPGSHPGIYRGTLRSR